MSRTDGEFLWGSYFEGKKVSEYDRRYWMFVKRFASLGENTRVLEAGCGSGTTLLRFNKSFTVGIDISTVALSLAKENLKGTNHALIKADIRRLPFRNNAFDLVYNSGVLEHFKSPEDRHVVSEMVRVAKSGSRVVVIVPNTLCLWYIAGKHVLRLLGRWRFGYEGSYSVWSLEKLLRGSGLDIESSTGIQLFPPSHDGFKRIYPQKFSRVLSAIERFLGSLNKFVAYAVAVTGIK